VWCSVASSADKQLQWLRDSTAASSSSSGNNSSSSNNNSGGAFTQGAPAAPGSAVPDLTAALGYRPIGIPQELFDRWTSMGGNKHPPQPPATVAAAAADTKLGAAGTTPGVGGSKTTAGSSAAVAGASNSGNGSHSSSRGSQQGASPGSSRPGSGFDLASKRSAAAAATPGHQDASPARRLSAANVPEGRRTPDGAGHSMMVRQRTADSASEPQMVSAEECVERSLTL
jgi:hypothetical protein